MTVGSEGQRAEEFDWGLRIGDRCRREQRDSIVDLGLRIWDCGLRIEMV